MLLMQAWQPQHRSSEYAACQHLHEKLSFQVINLLLIKFRLALALCQMVISHLHSQLQVQHLLYIYTLHI